MNAPLVIVIAVCLIVALGAVGLVLMDSWRWTQRWRSSGEGLAQFFAVVGRGLVGVLAAAAAVSASQCMRHQEEVRHINEMLHSAANADADRYGLADLIRQRRESRLAPAPPYGADDADDEEDQAAPAYGGYDMEDEEDQEEEAEQRECAAC
jgi:hypothetical protein